MNKKWLYLIFVVSCFLFIKDVFADTLTGKYFLNNFDEEGHKLNKKNGVFEVAADNSSKWFSYKDPYLKMDGDYFLLNFSLATVVKPEIIEDKNSLWGDDLQCMVSHSETGDVAYYCSQQDLYNHYVVPGDIKFTFYVRAIWDDDNWNTCQIQNSFASNVTLKCSIMNKNAKLKGFQIVSSLLSTGNTYYQAVYSFDSQLYAYKSESTIIQDNQQQTNDKLDDLNSSISGDSEDASSGKCGIICKLKNIVVGIAQLPIKIGEFIVNLGKQIGSFFENMLNFFKDDDVDSSSTNSFFSDFSTTDHGGVSGIITAPLKFVNKLTSQCQPININVLGKDVSLPCGDELFWNRPDVANFRIVWNILFGGIIIYGLVIQLFKTIERLKNPDDSRIELMKL